MIQRSSCREKRRHRASIDSGPDLVVTTDVPAAAGRRSP